MKSMARDSRGSDTVKSLSLRRKKLEKYFGILSKEEAEELESFRYKNLSLKIKHSPHYLRK
jgi:hypothetical protein